MVFVKTGVYVVRPVYWKNKFGEGNDGAVQSVFKLNPVTLDLMRSAMLDWAKWRLSSRLTCSKRGNTKANNRTSVLTSFREN
jgi:hypothetical protein